MQFRKPLQHSGSSQVHRCQKKSRNSAHIVRYEVYLILICQLSAMSMNIADRFFVPDVPGGQLLPADENRHRLQFGNNRRLSFYVSTGHRNFCNSPYCPFIGTLVPVSPPATRFNYYSTLFHYSVYTGF